MQFKRAIKSFVKLLCAIFGTSGAGKSYTMLRIATGIGGRIAAIDTEHGSLSKYADRFVFDVLDLIDTSIDSYIEAINEAARAGYDILIIDSLSHAWQILLEKVNKIANVKYKGNTFAAWSEGTPEQRKFIKAIVSFPGHVLVTIRSKTEWSIEDAGNGKKAPVRVGLAPEQGKGIEYEFDLLLEISPDHICRVIKDRTGKYQDKMIEKPGEDFGRELKAWLSEGALPPEPNYEIAPIGKNAGKSWFDHTEEALLKAKEYYIARPNDRTASGYLLEIERALSVGKVNHPATLSDTVITISGGPESKPEIAQKQTAKSVIIYGNTPRRNN
ncbi:MAG: ATP-binding protein [Spirochaetota bacterium]